MNFKKRVSWGHKKQIKSKDLEKIIDKREFIEDEYTVKCEKCGKRHLLYDFDTSGYRVTCPRCNKRMKFSTVKTMTFSPKKQVSMNIFKCHNCMYVWKPRVLKSGIKCSECGSEDFLITKEFSRKIMAEIM